MKRFVSLTLVVLIGLFMLSSCGMTANDEANASTIIANYSIKNGDDKLVYQVHRR